MSRGLGALQRRILDALAAYQLLGPALGWEAGTDGRWSDRDRREYEAGRLVETWKLLRDTGASKASLSRALRTLAARGHVRLSTSYLVEHGDLPRQRSAKTSFVALAGKTSAPHR